MGVRTQGYNDWKVLQWQQTKIWKQVETNQVYNLSEIGHNEYNPQWHVFM